MDMVRKTEVRFPAESGIFLFATTAKSVLAPNMIRYLKIFYQVRRGSRVKLMDGKLEFVHKIW